MHTAISQEKDDRRLLRPWSQICAVCVLWILLVGPTVGHAQRAEVLVESNVSEATILVDGETVGQTNAEGEALVGALAPGRRTLELRKDGYWSASSRVLLEPDLTTTVRLEMNPRPTDEEAERPASASDTEGTITAGTGTPDTSSSSADTAKTRTSTAQDSTPARLIVKGDVEGARVSLNDSLFGQTGRSGQIEGQVEPGRHQIAVSKDGYTTEETTARLEAGERHTLTVDLQATSSFLDRYPLLLFLLVLLGLGVVVVAFFVLGRWNGPPLARWFREKERFDRYVLSEVLRRSEFATVHLAHDPVDDRQVALKVLDDPYAQKPDHVQKFLEKGRVLHRIRETDPEAPVMDVYRVGRENSAAKGRPFMALEHVQGDNLLVYLKERGSLDVQTALVTIRQVCVGLRAAHENNVHHGALTPESIIVTGDTPHFGIKLIGFGLGADEHPAQVVTDGTGGSAAAYIAPEQFQNGRGDWRADMYAVGMLFYKLVMGAPPFAEDDPHRVMKMHAEATRPDLPDHVPSPVKPVFYRMISKNPERRPTASRVVSVLDLIQVAT